MTRPRPSNGPALAAGAVDLSALKQRATAPAAGGGPPAGVEITEANFEAEVITRSNQLPVVVLVWSSRSEASRQLAEILAGWASGDGGTWALRLVNADTAPQVAGAFRVQAIPTVIAVVGGKLLASLDQLTSPDQLRQWIDAVLAEAGNLTGAGDSEVEEEVDPALEQARAYVDDGEFEAAKAAYEAILATDPAHAEAKGAVRQITFLSRASAHPPDAIAVADAAPSDIDAALAAADVEILQQEIKAGFDRLIAVVRRTAGDERALVRTRLIELFELFDPADPDVIAARRNLANALY